MRTYLLNKISVIAKGIYEMDNLNFGGYFLYEKTAPEGYVRDTEYHYFEIKTKQE